MSYTSASMNQHPIQHSNEQQSPRLPSANDSCHLPGGRYHSSEVGAHHTHWSVDANTIASRQVVFLLPNYFHFIDTSLAPSNWEFTPR